MNRSSNLRSAPWWIAIALTACDGATSPPPSSPEDIGMVAKAECIASAQAAGAQDDTGSARSTVAVDITTGAEVAGIDVAEESPDPELSHDWGEVPSGTEVRHTFVLRNTSVATIRILRTMPTMRCRMKFDRAIAPGAEGRFEVVLQTADRPLGLLRLAIRVQTAGRVGDRTIVLQGKIAGAGNEDGAAGR